MPKKKSAIAMLLQVESRLVEAGHYEVTATVPTGIGEQTLNLKRTIRRIGDKRWALLDQDDTILHTLNTKKDAVLISDRLLGEMVRKAEQIAEERKRNSILIEPTESAGKVRYPFDLDTAHAALLEASPEYRLVSLHHGNRMVALMLADWYQDRRSKDMAVFARAWVARRRTNGREGTYPKAPVVDVPAAPGRS